VPILSQIEVHVAMLAAHIVNGPEIIKGEVNPGQSGSRLHQYLQDSGQEVLPVSQHVVVYSQRPGPRLLHFDGVRGALS